MLVYVVIIFEKRHGVNIPAVVASKISYNIVLQTNINSILKSRYVRDA